MGERYDHGFPLRIVRTTPDSQSTTRAAVRMGEPPIIASGSRKKWENGSRREKERKSGAKRGKGEKGGDLRLRRPSVRMMEKRVWLKKYIKKEKKEGWLRKEMRQIHLVWERQVVAARQRVEGKQGEACQRDR